MKHVRLAKLRPRWLTHNRTKFGIAFRCPLHPVHEGQFWFANPLGHSNMKPPKGNLHRTGTALSDLSLTHDSNGDGLSMGDGCHIDLVEGTVSVRHK